MNRAVFDTNVLVAGFLSPAGPPGRIVEWLRAGSVVAVVDDRIFSEYAEVLIRPAFCSPEGEVNIVLAAIGARANWAAVGAGYRRHPRSSSPRLERSRLEILHGPIQAWQ